MQIQDWLTKLHKAWAEGETTLVPELFARCESYWESPWEKIEPENLMEVWKVLQGKKAQNLAFDILYWDNQKCLLNWVYVNHEGQESAGALWLQFDLEGQCRELRMWWMKK